MDGDTRTEGKVRGAAAQLPEIAGVPAANGPVRNLTLYRGAPIMSAGVRPGRFPEPVV